MRFDDKVKEQYESMKIHNSITFSNMVIRDLQLGITPDGFIYAPEVLNPITNSPEPFSFNGFRYVEYTERGMAIVEGNNEVRLFDPYNNMGLMLYCLQWYLVNVKEIDINHDILSMFITNNKMNSIGHSEIRIFGDADMSKFNCLAEFNPNMLCVVGHDYTRDCLKYYDMIMIFDNTLPYEFYSDEINSIDMVPFDVYYAREAAIHDAELNKRKHMKLKTIVTRVNLED